ncbi:hypothetical protein CPB83DRAFT_342807 [Crepidotus variabilis]|uniref:Uncharacterized protein n=1 Tax=Crepidotus variabilis TaxID=179855 RepID=A0A9P6JPM4_9AGAR|nr:hypothetical protein CPB83DRAFT_342807 [Crepidotus variabilis]
MVDAADRSGQFSFFPSFSPTKPSSVSSRILHPCAFAFFISLTSGKLLFYLTSYMMLVVNVRIYLTHLRVGTIYIPTYCTFSDFLLCYSAVLLFSPSSLTKRMYTGNR